MEGMPIKGRGKGQGVYMQEWKRRERVRECVQEERVQDGVRGNVCKGEEGETWLGSI